MLEPVERQRVDSVAARQISIEQRILSSAEAAQVVLPASSLSQALAEVRGRYASDDEFLADIENSGLDQDGLMNAIERDLKFDAILDGVASRIVDVSETDIEIFYLMHREKFRRSENRTLRHILVTINESLKGNDRASARRKIDNVRARLLKSPHRFAELAERYSECTTALNGGLLGTVEKGQLFPNSKRRLFPSRQGSFPGWSSRRLAFISSTALRSSPQVNSRCRPSAKKSVPIWSNRAVERLKRNGSPPYSSRRRKYALSLTGCRQSARTRFRRKLTCANPVFPNLARS